MAWIERTKWPVSMAGRGVTSPQDAGSGEIVQTQGTDLSVPTEPNGRVGD